MSRPSAPSAARQFAFDEVCGLVERVLRGTMRRDIVDGAARARSVAEACKQLRESMRADVWGAGAARVELGAAIAAFDRRARQDGFHAIHDWDGKAERVNEDTIAIDVLNYAIDNRGEGPPDRRILAILLDYYFLYVLVLLSLKVWDEGTPDTQLSRLDALLGDLQGPYGSGQRFAADGATLLLLATSHYESDDRGYDTLLERVRSLGPTHRSRVAHVHAGCLGSHLRFGIEATYGQDFTLMREDNGVDYRWLSFSLSTSLDDYEAARRDAPGGRAQQRAAEALLNGLTADVEAFVGERLLPSLASCEPEWHGIRDRVRAYRADLEAEFEPFRPTQDGYSPISLFSNFSQNVLKGIVLDAVLWGEPWRLGLNDLLTTDAPEPDAKAAKLSLARTLMEYARRRPDRIRGLLMPAIVYDLRAGRRAFSATMRRIGQA